MAPPRQSATQPDFSEGRAPLGTGICRHGPVMGLRPQWGGLPPPACHREQDRGSHLPQRQCPRALSPACFRGYAKSRSSPGYPAVPLPKLTKSLKGITAKRANAMLALTRNPFWQEESYDHLVRHMTEFEKIRNYIEENPVRAGSAGQASDYR